MSRPESEESVWQGGPSSLPYSDDVKYLIRQHLLSLSSAFPSLKATSATFTHNDGLTTPLLQASGTLPILFNSHTYNLPLIIWLLESYPRLPPLVFLNPTRDMIIKRNHPFVNPSGVVSLPYLDHWLYPTSNLLQLANDLALLFGKDPPLYSRPRPNPNPITNYYTPPTTTTTTTSNFSSHNNNLASRPRPYPPSPYGGGGKYTDDAGEVFKRNAMSKLVESLSSDMGRMRMGREGEVERLFNVQGVLKEREGELARGVKEMVEEKERLEETLKVLAVNGEALEGWLRENEGKVEVLRSVDLDEAFDHCDELSKQMFECTASDLAMEDVIYALDKAVQDGAVPFDQYLRNVRMLAREQFIHRATASKVRAVQMQNQVSNMASRAPAYAL